MKQVAWVGAGLGVGGGGGESMGGKDREAVGWGWGGQREGEVFSYQDCKHAASLTVKTYNTAALHFNERSPSISEKYNPN